MQYDTDGSRKAGANDQSKVQLTLDFDAPRTSVGNERALPAACELARCVAAILETEPERSFDNAAVSKLAREFFGSSASHARDAYDAVEAGFNVYLSRVGLNFENPRKTLKWLTSEQARLPLQSRRDQTQIDFQQFSTPPAEAFVVATAASLDTGMEVLEPSAGTGNLAAQARLAGATAHTNEIDGRRRKLLSLQGFEPTAFDAERLSEN